MYKKSLALFFVFSLALTASSQTLFTYGKYSVDAKEFLRAYNKNNAQPTSNKAKSISDYLQLYINSRLKIREAYERKYDTLPQIKTEVDNLREQIVDNYMSDPAVVERLQKEAFQRSLKDIHVAHIFISFRNASGQPDSAKARQRVDEVMKQLQNGGDFGVIAQNNSDDPSAKTNKGNMGYITVFTLPYEFENVIYATAAGKYSMPYRSKIGYHIFKNIGERKAVGKMKAQQILLAIPPGSDDKTVKQIAARADSIYKRVMAGDDFSKLATAFSNDYVSSANSGTMPDISVGQYDAVFENVLWGLKKDGDVSKPFSTSHGWHIIKRVTVKPVITDPNNKDNQQDLQQKITVDGRWKTSRDFIYARVSSRAGFQKMNYSDDVLWALSDSLLNFTAAGIGREMSPSSPIFKIGDSVLRVSHFVIYAQANRFKADGSGVRPYSQVMEDFVHDMMFRYYRDHLESFNEDFMFQMNEFRDGNLFFEIMQQEVWNKAQADSAAIMALYQENKKKYTWNASADAIVFFCADPASAKIVYDQVKKDPAGWKKIADSYSEKVVADSSRFEWAQLPNLNNAALTPGMITPPLQNPADNSASFAYILKVYPQPMQRSFEEARGAVINDYQALIEQQWTENLRKKYPVVIDQKVLASISK